MKHKKCLCTTWGVAGENFEYNGCPIHTPKMIENNELTLQQLGDPYSEIDILKKALERIANTPDDYEMEYCRNIAIRALEELI